MPKSNVKTDSKYETKDISFEGCDPVIEEHLRANKQILCEVWDNPQEKKQVFVIFYRDGRDYPYRTTSSYYKNARPVLNKVMKVKKASVIVKWLEDNEYKVDGNGRWCSPSRCTFTPGMFQSCGFEPSSNWQWRPEWLEEV